MIAEHDQLLRRIHAHRVVVIERLRDPFAIPLAKDQVNIRMRVLKLMNKQFDLAHSAFSQLKTKLIEQGEDVTTIMGARRTSPKKEWRYEPLKDRDEYEVMREAIGDLERFNRYERRAWSRRKRAIREFIAIKARSEE